MRKVAYDMYIMPFVFVRAEMPFTSWMTLFHHMQTELNKFATEFESRTSNS